jgi:hypothetical protein
MVSGVFKIGESMGALNFKLFNRRVRTTTLAQEIVAVQLMSTWKRIDCDGKHNCYCVTTN